MITEPSPRVHQAETVCRLCLKSTDLQGSHIFPKFVFDWMKATGPKYLRYAGTPNLRRQDGPREKLLCAACEEILSKDERSFAKHIFHPFLDCPTGTISYDGSLTRFLTSVAWRVLISRMYGEHPAPTFDKPLSEAQEEWRKYLLGEADLGQYDRFHLVITNVLADETQPGHGLNQYLMRGVDATVAMSSMVCAVYAKFSRFAIWAEITRLDEKLWQNTRVTRGGGVLNTTQYGRYGFFGDFLLSRAKAGSELYQRLISDNQKKLLNDNFRRDVPSLRGTDFWEALEADMTARIDPHQWTQKKCGRNEMCPCGSGRKYKHCHGR